MITDEEFAPSSPVDETPAQVDYFGFQQSERFYFPDKVTYVEYNIMSEGMKSKFQKMTQRDVVVEKGSGNARMRMDPASERHELIRQCVTGWNLVRNGSLVPFDSRSLKDFLELADPRLIEDLEKALRKANPWLLGEMASEDIEKEIENLQEMLEIAKEREQGEALSGSK